MAVIIGSETYTRWVFDPDEGERRFRVNGKLFSVEDLEEALKEEGAELDEIVTIPNEDARKINVVFRPLSATDKYAIHDLLSVTGDGAHIASGSGRRLQMLRAIQKWDYDIPWTANVLDHLDPGLEEMLYKWISWGVEPQQQDEETGQPIPLPEPTPNRAERRASGTKKTSTKTTTADTSLPPSVDAESS